MRHCRWITAGVLALLLPASALYANGIKEVGEHLFVAGQPDAEEFTEFARRGGMHVIDLRPPGETPDFNEAAVVTRAGMAYYNIPVAGAAGLTRDNVAQLDRLLRRLDGETTLLHCSTSNRVGALMALRARWIEGASTDEALATGKRHGLASLQPRVEQLLHED